jgi:hypothetical protein
MYVEAFGRSPHVEELSNVESFLAAEQKSDAQEEIERVWTSLAHVLFNTKEFVFVE